MQIEKHQAQRKRKTMIQKERRYMDSTKIFLSRVTARKVRKTEYRAQPRVPCVDYASAPIFLNFLIYDQNL